MALPKASDNPFPSLLVVEGTAPSSPASGDQRLFIDSADHKLKRKDSGGTVTAIEAAGGTTIGRSQLVYRYTVAGTDKTSIDTGVDAASAGDNDWTGGDLLEMWLYVRTDDTSASNNLALSVNNDSGANYDIRYVINGSTTGTSLGAASWSAGVNANGAGAAASYFTSLKIVIPDFAGTVGFKAGELSLRQPDTSAGNATVGDLALGYRSTSAITRFAVASAVSGKKLKVGTQLLIYKRLAS